MAAAPLYFGESNRRLYGVYHHAEAPSSRVPGVLLFNPFGEEAIRAYRIFKLLAERLARIGAPVLRFDYFGAGDSAGDCADVTFGGMVRDAASAQEELQAMSAKRRFAWIGLGLGGAVAAAAARENDVRLEHLFLWDAVVNGTQYLRELHAAHLAFLARNLDQPAGAVAKRVGPAPDTMAEALGFAVSQALSREVGAIDLSKTGFPRAARVHFMRPGAHAPESSVVATAESAAKSVHVFEDDSDPWNSDDALNSYFIPTAAIDYIVDAIGSNR